MAGGDVVSRAGLFLLLVAPVAIGIVFYQLEEFSAVAVPGADRWDTLKIPLRNDHLASVSEKLGEGLLPGPEDLAYDPHGEYLYTGCADGWIKRVSLNGSSPAVENWAYVGGRPLGLVFSPDGQLVVAEADKGLMRVTREGTAEILATEAEGMGFALTDGVDVASDGIIYFTDASYKYNLHDHMLDTYEGRPHGRLLSFDPELNRTTVLVRDLYFANGVALSPGQDFLVFCETVVRRCRKYYIQGENKGTVDNFIDNLEGFPDNIRYGDGHFWIGVPSKRTLFTYLMMKYPAIRKVAFILSKYGAFPNVVQSTGGVLTVDLEGKPIAIYSDASLALVTGGLKVGAHLFYGFLVRDYIGQVDLSKLGLVGDSS